FDGPSPCRRERLTGGCGGAIILRQWQSIPCSRARERARPRRRIARECRTPEAGTPRAGVRARVRAGTPPRRDTRRTGGEPGAHWTRVGLDARREMNAWNRRSGSGPLAVGRASADLNEWRRLEARVTLKRPPVDNRR